MFTPSRAHSRGQFRTHPYRQQDDSEKKRHPTPTPQSRAQPYSRARRFISNANFTPLGPKSPWRHDSDSFKPPRCYDPKTAEASGYSVGVSGEGVSRINRGGEAGFQAESRIKEELHWRAEVERQLETQIGLAKEAKHAQLLAETELKMETNRRIDVERALEMQIRLAEEAVQARLKSEDQLQEERRLGKGMERAWMAAEVRTKEECSRRLEMQRQLDGQIQLKEMAEHSRIVAELRVEKETRARQIAEREMAEYAEMQRALQVERNEFMRLVTEARIQVVIEAQKRTEIEERLQEQDQFVSHLRAQILVEQGRWNGEFSQGQPGGSGLNVDVSMSSILTDDDHTPIMDASMSSIPASESDTFTSVPTRTPSPPFSNTPPPDRSASTPPPIGPQPVPCQAQVPGDTNNPVSDPHVREASLPVTNNSDHDSSSPLATPAVSSSSPAPLREELPPTSNSPPPYLPPLLPKDDREWFELYESRWQGIRRSSSACPLTFAHFPWPVFRFINSVDELREQDIRTFFASKYPAALDRNWKEELRRWHTDKLPQMLGRILPSCAAEVEDGFLRCIKVITAFNTEGAVRND